LKEKKNEEKKNEEKHKLEGITFHKITVVSELHEAKEFSVTCSRELMASLWPIISPIRFPPIPLFPRHFSATFTHTRKEQFEKKAAHTNEQINFLDV
jgi:hypothetical protein